MNIKSQSSSAKFDSTFIIFGLIALVSCLLRSWQYYLNRPMDRDELVLALNILTHDLATITNPIYGHDGDPIGYLLIQHAVNRVFGDSQFALRGVAFVCSILSVFVFHIYAADILKKAELIVADLMFSGSGIAIWFSSSTKQYAADLLIAVVLQILLVKALHANSIYKYLISAALGVVAIWISYQSIFILSGVLTVTALQFIYHKKYHKLKVLIGISIVSAVSFYSCYKLSMRKLVGGNEFYQYWLAHSAYPPNTFFSVENAKWYYYQIFEFVGQVGKFAFVSPVVIFILIGLRVIAKNSYLRVSYLLAPFILLFIASFLHLYPVPFCSSVKAGRFVVFLIPNILIFISSGLIEVARILSKLSLKSSWLLVACFVFQPIIFSVNTLSSPVNIDEVENALRYISEHQQDKDVVYGGQSVEWFYLYYKDKMKLNDLDVHWSKTYGEVSLSEEPLFLKSKNRVWIIIRATDLREDVAKFLDARGKKLGEWDYQNCSMFLYDFSSWT